MNVQVASCFKTFYLKNKVLVVLNYDPLDFYSKHFECGFICVSFCHIDDDKPMRRKCIIDLTCCRLMYWKIIIMRIMN